MRTLSIIAIAAALATPVAAVQIVEVLSNSNSVAELSIEERGQIAAKVGQERPGHPFVPGGSIKLSELSEDERNSHVARLDFDELNNQFAGVNKNKRQRKDKIKIPSPIFDEVLDTQIG